MERRGFHLTSLQHSLQTTATSPAQLASHLSTWVPGPFSSRAVNEHSQSFTTTEKALLEPSPGLPTSTFTFMTCPLCQWPNFMSWCINEGSKLGRRFVANSAQDPSHPPHLVKLFRWQTQGIFGYIYQQNIHIWLGPLSIYSRSICHIITRTFYQPHSSFCVVESHYFICLTVNMKMLSLIIIIIVQAEMRNDGLYFISVRTSSARR